MGDDEVDGVGEDLYGDLVGFEDLSVNAHFRGGFGFEGHFFASVVDDERGVFGVFQIGSFFITAHQF